MNHTYRKHIKAALWQFASLARLQRNLLLGQSCILGFHRVIDAPIFNGLNCSIHLFDALCAFLKNNFNVVPLQDMVARLQDPESEVGPFEVAITFDDGYEDNFSNAAPVLQSHGLAATFFLTTDFIGASKPPVWDEKAGEFHPFMTWEQAQALHAGGFSIGSHTCSHPNLAQLPLDAVRCELLESKQLLTRKLGAPTSLFAYPFGGKNDITPEAVEAVRQAEYVCCCDLGGGLNNRQGDTFLLKRIPMSDWYLSPAHYGGDILVLALKGRRALRQAARRSPRKGLLP